MKRICSAWRGAAVIATLAACSSPITGGSIAVDGGSASDVAKTDVPAATDVPTATDVPAAMDVPTATDIPAATDVPAATDIPMACAMSQLRCGASCVDAQTDRANCGACGTACTGIEACIQGRCTGTCPTGQAMCAGLCVDTQTDARHCGGCGMACPGGQVCGAGRCATVCATGQTACGAACANLQTDATNCGSCGNACAAGRSCVMGACALVCATGQTACGAGDAARCVDTQTDRGNCGACGTACMSGQICTAGRCVTSCPTGQTACDNRCSDLQTDPVNCGMCGRPCGNGQACVAGTCRGSCPAPFSVCGSVCADTRYNPDHCGGCGNACPPYPNLTRTCGDGQCVPGVCQAGFANCNAMLVDGCEVSTQTDVNNCGMCGRACPTVNNASGVCIGGSCAIGACNAGFANCDGNATNGCESNLQTDRLNCGACGVTCVGVCRDSVCTATIHNSEAFTSTTLPGGGCSYASAHQHNWVNLGNLNYQDCLRAASRVGGMLAPSVYTTPTTGWYGHRLGSVAMTGAWSTYQTAPVTSSVACIVARDRRSTMRDAPLAETATYDGQTWRFEDYGPRFYDECQLLASNAGASIITPHTVGRTATASYWVHQIHLCNVYAYVNASGTGFAYDNYSVMQRSSQQRCMVGYVDN